LRFGMTPSASSKKGKTKLEEFFEVAERRKSLTSMDLWLKMTSSQSQLSTLNQRRTHNGSSKPKSSSFALKGNGRMPREYESETSLKNGLAVRKESHPPTCPKVHTSTSMGGIEGINNRPPMLLGAGHSFTRTVEGASAGISGVASDDDDSIEILKVVPSVIDSIGAAFPSEAPVTEEDEERWLQHAIRKSYEETRKVLPSKHFPPLAPRTSPRILARKRARASEKYLEPDTEGKATSSKFLKFSPAKSVFQSTSPAASNDDDSSKDKATTSKVPPGDHLYTFNEFDRMFDDVFLDFGMEVTDVEEGCLVRTGNSKVSPSDTKGQSKAQYGRLLPTATQYLLADALCVTKKDTFVDIGHGIGNAVIQAAYTMGCESRGIEVMAGRNLVAELIMENLEGQRKVHHERDNRSVIVGKILLRHGRLEVPEHRTFLTNPEGVTKAFLDNFNGVFADRSAKLRQRYTLDQYNAGLFALMKPGSMLVALHKLDLGPTYLEANTYRKRHNLANQDNILASFYALEEFSFGPACNAVTWSQGGGCTDAIIGYKYTRLNQKTPEGKAVFLCCNRDCDIARAGTPIDATRLVESDEGDGTRVVINTCICKYTPIAPRSGRNRRPRKFRESLSEESDS
jgi:hypothetical protein